MNLVSAMGVTRKQFSLIDIRGHRAVTQTVGMLARYFLGLMLVSLLLSGPATATELGLPRPGTKDTCPVCGMFVAK